MESFKFYFNDKEYTLSEVNLEYFQNDEEVPVIGIDANVILSLLNQKKDIEFATEYYDLPCGSCGHGKDSKNKYFDYLEYHFYIFTKEANYILSSISKAYIENSLDALMNSGKIDDSYLVSIAVCKNCSSYSIELGTVHK